jgi:hypothetical protein
LFLFNDSYFYWWQLVYCTLATTFVTITIVITSIKNALNGGLNNTYVSENKVKVATQMSEHFLKLHFCMFERSQMKYNSLDCHNFFRNIFH